jgi:exosortase
MSFRMAATPGSRQFGKWAEPDATRWAGWFVLAAIGLLGIPTIYQFATIFWSRPDDAHEPLVLMGVMAGFWRERAWFNWRAGSGCSTFAPSLAVSSIILYAIGSSQEFYQMEGLGLLGFVVSCLLLTTDQKALRRVLWLSVLCLFVIPVPGTLLDAVLLPMKLVLTEGVVRLFSFLGYPVASHGVIISVGFYQLQVADACAGLRSMLALTAIGLFFLYFIPSRNRPTNVVILALIAPFAIFANFCRISLLVALTYYFGGDFSESFHSVAGYGEIAVTLGLFFAAHYMLERTSLRLLMAPLGRGK